MYNKMYKYITLFLAVYLFGALCDLNKEEGDECEWEGVKGKCVKETRCMTTLDKNEPYHLVCSKQGTETIVCCTDCELVNDTRDAVVTPTGGLYFKNGQKARDHCLQYIQDELPYQCRQIGFYGGIQKRLDEEQKCHKYNIWAIGGSPPPGWEPSAKYPHQALLGYGEDLATAKWLAGGSIISDRYILTAAHARGRHLENDLKFVALNVKNRSDPSTWQTHKVKRFITYPEYVRTSKYHDIALIETETPIKFDNTVLPACLHVEKEIDIDEAVATTWRDLKDDDYHKLADTQQTIQLEKFTDEECKAAYSIHRSLKQGIDTTTQMCYGSKTNPTEASKGFGGEPLLVDNQFSSCVYTVIGITSFGTVNGRAANKSIVPDVYTRVSYYVPWIESVVWP